MTRQKISLGKILGINIDLDYSWFLIFILLTWTLAASYFPSEFSSWSTPLYWVVGAVTAILFFASVLLHELGHSIVARGYKVPVRRITLFIFGGIAQIAGEPPSAVAEFWIALAGPLVSFTLAGLFSLLQNLGTGFTPILALFKYLAYINATLALFNLIPGFPLDGGRILRAILWGSMHNLKRATQIAARVGKGIAYLFILFGIWQMLGGNFAGGLWIALIGWFLNNAASSQLNQQALFNLLAGHTAGEAMYRNYRIVSPETTLRSLWEINSNQNGQHGWIVGNNEDSFGVLTMDNLERVPRDSWADTTVSQVMIPMERLGHVRPDTDLEDAVRSLERGNLGELPVMEAGRLLGLLDSDSIRVFLSSLRAIQQSRPV